MKWAVLAAVILATPGWAEAPGKSPRPVPRAAVITAAHQDRQEGIQNWIVGFRARALVAGISEAVLDQAMLGVRYDPAVIRRDRNQAEFTKTIWDYLDTAVYDLRITNGRAALARQAGALKQIEVMISFSTPYRASICFNAPACRASAARPLVMRRSETAVSR